MTFNLEETKIIKEMYKKFDEFKESINNQVIEIKKEINNIKNEKQDNVITEKDVKYAWMQYRLDVLTGIKKMSSGKLNNLNKYINNIDLNNIPYELKEYLDRSDK